MKQRLLKFSLLIIFSIGIAHTLSSQGQSDNTIEINWESSDMTQPPVVIKDRNPEKFLVEIKDLKKTALEKIIIDFKKVDGKMIGKAITFDGSANKEIFKSEVKESGDNISFSIVKMMESLSDETEKILIGKVLDITKKSNIVVKIYGVGKTGDSPYKLTLMLSAQESPKKNGMAKKVTLNQLPIPVFQSTNNDERSISKKNRFLFIDASRKPELNVGTVLYKRKTGSSTESSFVESHVEVNSLDSRGNLKVLIRADNFFEVEQVSINVVGVSYTYEQDLSAFSSQFKLPKTSGDSSDGDNVKIEADTNQTTDKYLPYLEKAYTLISENKHLNIEDIYVLNTYKAQLKEFTDNLSDSLSPSSLAVLGNILSWYPDYVFLNSKAIEIPDDDEVAISAQFIKEGNKTEYFKLGTYKTKGGMGFNFGSLFYVTGLNVNDVYTKQVSVNDSTKELRAIMDSTNKVSVGIGMNAEIYFRTGSLVKPTINIGFFVPLGQELVPYLAVGPGLTIGNKKVKFSLNGGFAFGQVNAIAERYKDVDVSGVEDISSITKKVWKPSWYVGVGVSFNLAK